MPERTSDGGSKKFDPRFSREFQPGFDPRVHREAPPTVNRESAPRPTTPSLITRTTRAKDASTSAPSLDSDSGHDAASAATATPVAVAPRDSGASGEPLADPVDDVETPFWRRLNPYMVALGVIGVALIGAALGWMAWVYSIANNPLTQQFDYLIMQFAMFGAPVLLSVGVATLVSILVILAARWRR